MVTLTDSIRRHEFTDFTCAIEVAQMIVVLDSAIANATFSSAGLTANFDGTTMNADSVAWDFGDGSEWATEEDPTHLYDAIGDYDVWFYAYGPCNTDSIGFTVTIDDVSLTENELEVSIYPNPSNGQVYLKGLNAGTTVEVINILGEVIYANQTSGGTFAITTANLAQGAYFIRMKNASGETTRKLVVKH
jgi:PKD repeat protein